MKVALDAASLNIISRRSRLETVMIVSVQESLL